MANLYGLIAIAFAVALWSPDYDRKDRARAAVGAAFWPLTVFVILAINEEEA